jgi:hypothetical protein
MLVRFASINDLPMRETERKYHWALGRRLDDHPGLSDWLVNGQIHSCGAPTSPAQRPPPPGRSSATVGNRSIRFASRNKK